MRPSVILRRFTPGIVISAAAFLKYRAFVSIRAEVELSALLVLGRGAKISSFTKIKAANGPLAIGENTAIGSGCFIGAAEAGTRIGRDCLIGPNCAIVSGSYRYGRVDQTFEDQGRESRGTVIGNNVLLGAGCVVVDGACIGDGVMASANSVLSGTIPDNAVVQGNPARVIFIRR